MLLFTPGRGERGYLAGASDTASRTRRGDPEKRTSELSRSALVEYCTGLPCRGVGRGIARDAGAGLVDEGEREALGSAGACARGLELATNALWKGKTVD
jgi:hypothetical protein